MIRLHLNCLLLTIGTLFSQCSQQSDELSGTNNNVEQVPLTPAPTSDYLTEAPASLRELVNDTNIRDVQLDITDLKVTSSDWLSCGRDELISEQARNLLKRILNANSPEELTLIRREIAQMRVLDPDTKAIAAMLIFDGVKDFSLPDSSYESDREYAYQLLQSITSPTLLSLQIKAIAYYFEWGAFDIGADRVNDLMDEIYAEAQSLESELSESQIYASHVIQDHRLAYRDSESEIRLSDLLIGEQRCSENSYFTVVAIIEHLDDYKAIRSVEEAHQRLDRIIENGVPAYAAKLSLYGNQINWNEDYTALAEPDDISQQELVKAAQDAYSEGVSLNVGLGTFITWCNTQGGLNCQYEPPYNPTYVELLQQQVEKTGNSGAIWDLARHFEATGNLEGALQLKWNEYKVDRIERPRDSEVPLRAFGDLASSAYGLEGLFLVSELINEYKNQYLAQFTSVPDNEVWVAENTAVISRYENSIKALVSSIESDSPVSRAPSSLSDISLGNQHALLIANSDYDNLIDLQSPGNDVSTIAEILSKRYGFETTVLIDATRSEILETLNRYRSSLTESDNLLLYYAGHGYIDPANDEAYWQPVDSHIDNDTNWISTNRVISSLRAMQANNIMVLADSCFSGALMREVQPIVQTEGDQGLNLAVIQQLNAEKSRVAISSGALEPVVDQLPGSQNSVFATAVIRFLENNRREAFSGRDLHLAVSSIVSSITDGTGISQNPLYSPLIRAGHDGGDFIFSLN